VSAGIVLGRDGLGDASEADFDSWVSYVSANIDERAGFEVEVDTRGERDVQSDEITGNDEQRETIGETVAALWEDWCAEGAPSVEVAS
jgi:hypothetical protein